MKSESQKTSLSVNQHRADSVINELGLNEYYINVHYNDKWKFNEQEFTLNRKKIRLKRSPDGFIYINDVKSSHRWKYKEFAIENNDEVSFEALESLFYSVNEQLEVVKQETYELNDLIKERGGFACISPTANDMSNNQILAYHVENGYLYCKSYYSMTTDSEVLINPEMGEKMQELDWRFSKLSSKKRLIMSSMCQFVEMLFGVKNQNNGVQLFKLTSKTTGKDFHFICDDNLYFTLITDCVTL